MVVGTRVSAKSPASRPDIERYRTTTFVVFPDTKRFRTATIVFHSKHSDNKRFRSTKNVVSSSCPPCSTGDETDVPDRKRPRTTTYVVPSNCSADLQQVLSIRIVLLHAEPSCQGYKRCQVATYVLISRCPSTHMDEDSEPL